MTASGQDPCISPWDLYLKRADLPQNVLGFSACLCPASNRVRRKMAQNVLPINIGLKNRLKSYKMLQNSQTAARLRRATFQHNYTLCCHMSQHSSGRALDQTRSASGSTECWWVDARRHRRRHIDRRSAQAVVRRRATLTVDNSSATATSAEGGAVMS